MNDIFKEQLIKRAPNTRDTLLKAAVVLGSVVLFLLVFIYISALLPVGLAVICIAAYFAFGMLEVEYEYILTNGELDIDCIYGKSRRKRVYSGELKSCEIMCHISEMGYEPQFNSAEVTKDCSSGVQSNNTYKFLTTYNGRKMKIIFEPNDEMIKNITPYVGQRKFIAKR